MTVSEEDIGPECTLPFVIVEMDTEDGTAIAIAASGCVIFSNSSIASGEFLPLLFCLNHCITFEALLVDAGISALDFIDSKMVSAGNIGTAAFFSLMLSGILVDVTED